MTERHLTIDELAVRLGVARKTIKNWNSLGKAPRRIRQGKTVRYRMRDIEAWERKREIAS